ncbi:MAG: hypothetical protein WB425_07020 [Terracidiphilus sp.]|jgi:hypothetical protein
MKKTLLIAISALVLNAAATVALASPGPGIPHPPTHDGGLTAISALASPGPGIPHPPTHDGGLTASIS